MSNGGGATSHHLSEESAEDDDNDYDHQSPIDGGSDSAGDDESFLHDTRDGADELHRGSMTSRVFMQTLANRLLLTQLEGDELDILNATGCDSSDDDDFASVMTTTTGSFAPSLSLSSLARAEQLLQRSVPLVNGGQHITLTKEDLERLRDSRLLQFLEANSAAFVKHLQGPEWSLLGGEAASAEGDPEVSLQADKSENAAGLVVNVLDDEGMEYHIYTDRDGKLLVPVGGEDEEEEQTVDEGVGEGRESNETVSSQTVVAGGEEASAAKKPASQEPQTGHKVKGKKSAKPFVRGIGLTAEEDRRVMELLQTDLTKEPSPYTLHDERAEGLEKRLKWFRDVRGPLKCLDADSVGLDVGGVEVETPCVRVTFEDEATAPSLKAIGNSYMREVREQRILQTRLKSINEELSALQDLQRLEALCPIAGVEQLAGAPRPTWSQEVPPPLGEDAIRELIEEARRENEAAVAAGEEHAAQSTDDLSYLQQKLRLAMSRVESLLPPSPSSA